MANDLTGDFDVVAEFSVPAANRVLAAMHRGMRLPHSWSLRVDDYHHIHVPLGAAQSVTGVRAVADAFGDAITNPDVVAKVSAQAPSATSMNVASDFVVNAPKPAGSVGDPASPVSPRALNNFNPANLPSAAALEHASHLVGVAQVQLGAPTISFGRSNHDIIVHTPVMVWYTPDDGTMDIPGYLHGEFQTTIEVQQVASPAGNFINVNLGGKYGNASFVPKWVLPAWDSEPDQLAAINKALTNSLKTSFEPSSTAIPPSVIVMNFKTLSGPQPALAMMMNLPGGIMGAELLGALFGLGTGAPDPGSVNNVFLTGSDDFAFAIRSDYIQTMYASAVDSLRQWSVSFWYQIEAKIPNPGSLIGWGPDSWTVEVTTITFTSQIDSVTVELQDPAPDYPSGRIFVTVEGTANTPTPGIPKVTFTATQALGLELIDSAYGSTADLVTLGGPDVTVSAGAVPQAIVDAYFTPGVTDRFKTQVANFVKSVNPGLQQKFSAKLNLGNFLSRLMNPTPKPGSLPVEQLNPTLRYTAYEITTAGIVLHGSLAVPAWTKPQVHFTFRNITKAGPLPRLAGEYNALPSWIPGGTIQEFVWNQQDGPVLHDDHHTFLFHESAADPIFRLCLTVKGSRISASGPATYQAVSATGFCSWHIRFSAQAVGASRVGDLPKIALTRKARSGGLEVAAHASPWAPPGTRPDNATNLIVHFPDQRSLNVEFLGRFLHQIGNGSSVGIVVVLSPEQLAKMQPIEGIAFADDEDAWAQVVPLQHRPATFLIDTAGDVIWQHQGAITNDELVSAIKEHLPKGGQFSPRTLRPNLRVGQPVPNFIFPMAPGQDLTLRKLAGRFVVLAFWKSSSRASLDALLDLQESFARSGAQGPVLLAINDGDPEELATKVAGEYGVTALVVPDPDGQITRACGINVWPTLVFLDDSGLVTDIRFGRFSPETGTPSTVRTGDSVTA
jgi:peroxiredoxin